MRNNGKRNNYKGNNKSASKAETGYNYGKGSEREEATNQSAQGTDPRYKKGKGSTGKGRNPIEIWNRNPELTKAACMIPFSQALGQPLQFDQAGGISKPCQTNTTVPGIMRLLTLLTYGSVGDKNSSLNLAARNIWTFMRSVNSGAKNYTDTALMQYFIAVDNAFALYSAAIRAFGTITQFRVLNRYTPECVVESQGLSYNDLYGKLAQFKFNLDEWGKRLQSFVVPTSIDIFKRHFDLFTNYYMDSDNAQKAQISYYMPAKVFKWIEDGENAGTFQPVINFMDKMVVNTTDGTVQVEGQTKSFTLDDLSHAMDDIIHNIAISEDFNVMAGDLLKAYGSQGVWTVPLVTEDYVATPVFNWEVLIQMHNATVFNSFDFQMNEGAKTSDEEYQNVKEITDRSDNLGQIYEVADGSSFYLRQHMQICSQTPAGAIAPVLDMPIADPTPEDIMEATRQTLSGNWVGAQQVIHDAVGNYYYTADVSYMGTEVIVGCDFFSIQFTFNKDTKQHIRGALTKRPLNNLVKSNGIQGYVSTHNIYSYPFTLAPLWYTFDDTDPNYQRSGDTSDQWGFLDTFELLGLPIRNVWGPLDNFVILGPDALNRMHRAAVLSIFGVPMNAFRG